MSDFALNSDFGDVGAAKAGAELDGDGGNESIAVGDWRSAAPSGSMYLHEVGPL
jgi:hypothetical protein